MTPGLSFFYGGMVSPKNVVSTMLQSFVALAWSACSGSSSGSAWRSATAIGGLVGNPLTFFMFRGVGEATRPAPVADDPAAAVRAVPAEVRDHHAGADHRRVRRAGAVLGLPALRLLFSLFIYAPLAHWTWHPDGFLRQWGVLDFAGGTVVHMSAGLGRAGRRAGAGPPPEPHRRRGAHAGEHPVRAARHRHAVVRLVRLQRRLRAGRQRHRGAWPSRPPTRRRRRRCWRGCSSTGCAARSRRRWAPASARWSAWWPSRRPPASSRSAASIVIGVVASARQQHGGPLEVEVDARRHARRVPLPRRRRHGRHDPDRGVRAATAASSPARRICS